MVHQSVVSFAGDPTTEYGSVEYSASCEVYIVASSQQRADSYLSFDVHGHIEDAHTGLQYLEPVDGLTRSVLSILNQTAESVRPRVLEAEDFDTVLNCIWTDSAAFVLVLEAGEWIEPDAIAQARQTLLDDDRADLVYSDHDHWSDESMFPGASGSKKTRFIDPVLKPAWSPELLRSWNYLGPLVVLRTSLIQRFQRPTGDPSPDLVGTIVRLSLAMQAIEHADGITHIAEVLAHRSMELAAVRPDLATLDSHQDRSCLQSTASLIEQTTARRTPALSRHPLVSLVVLTGGATRVVGGALVLLVENALRTVTERSTYSNFEIVVVLDSKSNDELATILFDLDPERIRIIKDDQPFNFSGANNLGAANANGEIVVFLNDDTEVVTPDWIERIVMNLVEPDVGVVGAQLLFGDGRIQHAGLVLRDGWVEHRLAGRDPGELEWAESQTQVGLRRSCDVSAVTGACLAMRRSDFVDVGGFSVEFPLNFNDVDLCLRMRARGQRVVLDQSMVLLHLETSSRTAGITDSEQKLFCERWHAEASLDPFHNPNLTQVRIEHRTPPAALLRLRRLVERKQRAALLDQVAELEQEAEFHRVQADVLFPFGQAQTRTVYQAWARASSS